MQGISDAGLRDEVFAEQIYESPVFASAEALQLAKMGDPKQGLPVLASAAGRALAKMGDPLNRATH